MPVLVHKEIENLLASVSAQASVLIENRQATIPLQVNLSAEMAAALGTPARRLTPFLATVVDVIASKLEVDDAKLKAGKIKVSKEIQQWLGDNHWSLIERELYFAVVRDGRAFILVSWGETGPQFTVREAHNGVCGAHVVEEDGEPVFAFNTWEVNGVSYFDLYHPDRIEKYIKAGGAGLAVAPPPHLP